MQKKKDILLDYTNRSLLISSLPIALIVELLALFFGFQGMDGLFEPCNYSHTPFITVLVLAVLGVAIAVTAAIRLWRMHAYRPGGLAIAVAVICTIMGGYGTFAASITIC